ncbi:MAG TPA: hypothetical protein DIT64_02865 [Verrucomicrobiales bacterium]|nr:hypothetical protein [Verrucomicrobiales bacterium]
MLKKPPQAGWQSLPTPRKLTPEFAPCPARSGKISLVFGIASEIPSVKLAAMQSKTSDVIAACDSAMQQDSTPPPVTENFNVHLGGTLSILSEAIYTAGPEVFVRELMQNGCDAITGRVLADPGFMDGAVSLDVVTGRDGSLTLIAEDNGIGLTLEESRRALSTIAFSSKRPDQGGADDSPYVGRFGIGLLSGFLVADEITVISRRAGGGHPAVHWTGRIDGTFTTQPVDGVTSTGTRVFLRLRPEAAREFTAEAIFEIAQKYGRYLPHPVTFRHDEHARLVTDEQPIWEREMDMADLLELGHEIFEVPMLSAYPFESAEAGAKGIAFIQAEPCHATAESTHVIFIKNMLVSERALDLEPPKAPFLRLIMNSDRLRPNAGRDAVMAGDPRLPALRGDIEAAFKEHLARLHREQPALCAAIVTLQYRCLGELAARDHAYLRHLIDHLPVETTLGRMTLGQIFKRHAGTLEYVTETTEFQRVQARARAEGGCIARVETEPAHRLMELVGKASKGMKVRRITASEYLARFTKSAGAPSQREQLMLELAEEELRPENCRGVFYDTDEPDEITRLDMGADESLERLLSVDSGDGSAAKKLLLNRGHPLISQMIDGAADAALLRVWIRVLYQFALLEAREVPTAAETRRFSRAIGNAFTASSLGNL